MKKTLLCMDRMYRRLIDNYQSSDSDGWESCGRVAVEIGESLKREGYYPEIKTIVVPEYDFPSNVFEAGLIPLVFRGKWDDGWKVHHLCCASGFAYEPLLRKPVPEESCSQLIFGEDLPLLSEFTFANFSRLVNRRR